MAGGNSPRQKMINLMYLVFIAMLALNISTEVLTAFGIMNERFQQANQRSKELNQLSFEALQQKASEEPQKYKEASEKAAQVREISEDLYQYIAQIKEDLSRQVGNTKDYKVMDKSDYLDERFFSADGLSSQGKEFLDKLNNYRNKIISILGENDAVSERVKSLFDTDPVTDSEGNQRDWMKYNFEKHPMIATLARFSQIQYDVVTTEENVYSSLLEGQLKAEISMTNYTTLLEQPRNAYYQGEPYDGSIVLGRKDNTTKPSEVELYLDGRKLSSSDYEIKDGKVQLRINSGNAGDHKITGNLYFDQEGERISVPVDQSFATISKPNSAVVSAEKMKVVYRAVQNPITISMPGVPDNKISASAPGLRKVSGSKYVLIPEQGSSVTINVSGEIDGKKFTSSQEFRIKDIPRPMGAIGGASGELKRSKNYVENATVSAVMEDFDFDLKLRVKSFMISVPGQPSIEVKGNRMDSRAKSLIARAKRGDIIRIFDIKSDIEGNVNYRVKPTLPVNIEITN